MVLSGVFNPGEIAGEKDESKFLPRMVSANRKQILNVLISHINISQNQAVSLLVSFHLSNTLRLGDNQINPCLIFV